jgi:SAM-dependent methyltransferase
VLAIERSGWCIEELEKRFAQTPNVTVRHADLVELFGEPQRYDSIVMINVLEHIEDDVAALASLRRLLVPGGRVVLYIPALNGLYGPWDRKVGHYRRYSKWRMRRVLDAAGLVEVDLRYMNSLSIPAWWIFSHGNVERSVAGRLNLWDKTGVPLGRLIESVIPPPLGCNVFCVARAKDEPTTRDH